MKTPTSTIITIEQIQSTKFYKKLTPLLKKFASNKKALRDIHNGYNVSQNIGFEVWEKQTKPRYYISQIVKELL